FLALGGVLAAVALSAGRARAAVAPATTALRNVREQAWRRPEVRTVAFVLLAAFVVLYPLGVSNFWKTVLGTQIGIYVLLALRLSAVHSDSVTNGANGAFGVPHFAIHLGPLNYRWGLASMPYYYLILVVAVLIVFFFHRLEDSRVGRFWTAIREDEVAAAAS